MEESEGKARVISFSWNLVPRILKYACNVRWSFCLYHRARNPGGGEQHMMNQAQDFREHVLEDVSFPCICFRKQRRVMFLHWFCSNLHMAMNLYDIIINDVVKTVNEFQSDLFRGFLVVACFCIVGCHDLFESFRHICVSTVGTSRHVTYWIWRILRSKVLRKYPFCIHGYTEYYLLWRPSWIQSASS
jgi:hypothetical protein